MLPTSTPNEMTRPICGETRPIDEKTWLVVLYRCETDGWKRQEVAEDAPSANSSQWHQHAVAVAPRNECVVFPNLRQRFSLKSETDQGTVIRRDDRILLTSKRRVRALLLQFQSLQDSLEFSDRFLELNPPPSLEEDEATTFDLERAQGRQPAGSIEQEQVVSYIARLLHDDGFLQFVHKMETYICSTDDGAKILRGLEQRDLPTT